MNIFEKIMLSAGFFCQLALWAEIDPDQALARLKEGNARYLKDETTCPSRGQIRREAVSSKQKPFATIVGCSDSRVAPEIVFDQGIGDLFVVRVAGNVVGPFELDSIDYSLLNLGSNLIVVLGHENCGAVKAVLDKTAQDIESLAKFIGPAIGHNHNLDIAIKANVRQVVKIIEEHAVISRLVKQKKVKVVGGYYHLVSGKVEFLES